MFQNAHDRKRITMFGGQIVALTDPDPVFAGAGAVHVYGAHDHPFIDPARDVPFRRLVGIYQKNDMKIAIPDMTDDGGKQTRLLDIRSCCRDTVGKP